MRPEQLQTASPAGLYPPVTPYASGWLEVGDGHSIYWEECGNPRGIPAVFLHSGPGGGCTLANRRLFNPQRYRILLFDQRGCGRSRSNVALHANSTAHLIDDLELLRYDRAIERWLMLGGSWGATLALAYAQAWPERVSALILRGVFTARREELHWLYQEGASWMYPEAWSQFIAPIPCDERGNLLAAYHARLHGAEVAFALAAAQVWCAWEDEIMTLQPQPQACGSAAQMLALARIQSHYFIHDAFIAEGSLIANADRLRHIPGVIVQGRHDAVTPPRTAWELQCAWPQAELQIVADAGHASSEPGILQALIQATDAWAAF